MFVNPTTPNLADYTSFLYSAVGIPKNVLPSAAGTATGGSLTTLLDNAQTWTVNQWATFIVVDSTQAQMAGIVSNTTNALTFSAPVPKAIAAGDQYQIAPDSVFTTFAVAQEIVNVFLNMASPTLYTLAVYNLAADRLINFAIDLPNQTYFQDLRTKFDLTVVTVGVPSSAADQGTSTGILNPEFMKTMTLQDLQALRTPYGRRYVEIALSHGPSLWGLT